MKMALFCMLCLLLLGCETEKVNPQEDSFLVEAAMTGDMQKIKDAFVADFQEKIRFDSEKRLKIAKAMCELYGKNDKQLDKEIKKINQFYDDYEPKNRMRKKLEAAIKGLKLDYNQVLPLTREIAKADAEIVAEDRKLFAPYKARAQEILKDIEAKNDTQKSRYIDYRYSIMSSLSEKEYNDYGHDMSYGSISYHLFCRIDDGTLEDSFLKKSVSPLKEEDENKFLHSCCSMSAPRNDDEGVLIFDAIRNAVKSTTIERKKLEQLVELARNDLEGLAVCILDIQGDVANDIERDRRCTEEHCKKRLKLLGAHPLVELAEKYPKFEDFQKQIDVLSTRLAYRTYCKINAARSLYAEWCRCYLSQMDEFFKNSRILAERLYTICKDEKINGDNSYQHEQNMNHIALIKEITSMGKKNVILPKRRENSLQKIKDAYSAMLNRLMPPQVSEPCASATFDAEVNAYAETEMTEDMQKIKDAFVAYIREVDRFSSEKMLKKAKAICELYGKSDKRLHEKITYPYEEIYDRRRKKLGAALKGLRLNHNQIPLLAQKIEKAEIDYAKLFAPYKTKAKEILKDIQVKKANDKEIDCWVEYEIRYIVNDKIKYKCCPSSMLFSYINDGTLKDSFLEKYASPLKEKDERLFLYSMWGPEGDKGSIFIRSKSEFNGISKDSAGNIIFDALGNDDGMFVFDAIKNAVQNTAIERKELERAVEHARSYLELTAECIARIQGDIADDIDRYNKFVRQYNEEKLHFFDNSYTRELLVELVEKYPKFEDFEKQIDALSTRLAYRTYCDVSAARFLYAEWRRNYLSRMDELFKNARILAERLYNICKDEETHEYKSNLDNIAVIKEIASLGPRLLSTPNASLSQQKIKESYKNWFMKTRESYLRHMRGKPA